MALAINSPVGVLYETPDTVRIVAVDQRLVHINPVGAARKEVSQVRQIRQAGLCLQYLLAVWHEEIARPEDVFITERRLGGLTGPVGLQAIGKAGQHRLKGVPVLSKHNALVRVGIGAVFIQKPAEKGRDSTVVSPFQGLGLGLDELLIGLSGEWIGAQQQVFGFIGQPLNLIETAQEIL